MSIARRTLLKTSAAALAPMAAAAPAVLPTVRFGGRDVSRLILGDNTFYGFSHFNKLFSDHMTEWATPENVCRTLRSCEANGINTWAITWTPRAAADLRRYHAEGGKMQWVAVCPPKFDAQPGGIEELAKLKPVGIVHHGAVTDGRWRRGEQAQIREFLKRVRDTGALVGLGTHNAAVLERVEEQNWDVDFYMGAVYNVTRTQDEIRALLGHVPLGEVYVPEDPLRMFRAIRQTRKPCLAFKVLAAGRATDVPAALRTALESIKPADAMIVGMYPRYSNQVKENADVVRQFAGKVS